MERTYIHTYIPNLTACWLEKNMLDVRLKRNNLRRCFKRVTSVMLWSSLGIPWQRNRKWKNTLAEPWTESVWDRHSQPLNHCIRVMVWRLGGNIIRTALCWIVWHNVHSPQHTYMSSSYRSNRLGLSHWNPYAVRRGGCLELYYCNMVEWFWWDSSLISTTNWFPSVLWHCWFGHLACKNRPRNDL